MQAVEVLSRGSALDQKTAALAYLAVLAALRLESGVPFHVGLAKRAGATRAEVVSAILVGLPAAGNAVTQCLPAALSAYDAGSESPGPCKPPLAIVTAGLHQGFVIANRAPEGPEVDRFGDERSARALRIGDRAVIGVGANDDSLDLQAHVPQLA
jgi:Carboxymuconolactone decarboxylase family